MTQCFIHPFQSVSFGQLRYPARSLRIVSGWLSAGAQPSSWGTVCRAPEHQSASARLASPSLARDVKLTGACCFNWLVFPAGPISRWQYAGRESRLFHELNAVGVPLILLLLFIVQPLLPFPVPVVALGLGCRSGGNDLGHHLLALCGGVSGSARIMIGIR